MHAQIDTHYPPLSLLWSVLCSNISHAVFLVYWLLSLHADYATMCTAYALIDTHYPSLPLLRLLETRLMMVRPTRSLHCALALQVNTNNKNRHAHTNIQKDINTYLCSDYLPLYTLHSMNLYWCIGNNEMHICQTHWTLMMVKPQLAVHAVLFLPQILVIFFTFVYFWDFVSSFQILKYQSYILLVWNSHHFYNKYYRIIFSVCN